MMHRLCDFIFLCAQQGRNLSRLLLFRLIVLKRPSAAEHCHAGTALIPLHMGQFDQTDLAGLRHMGSTACTHVISRNHNDPHLSLNFNLAPVFHAGKLLL